MKITNLTEIFGKMLEMKDRKTYKALPFTFKDPIAPGAREVVEVEPLDLMALRPSRVIINPSDHDKGADFDGLNVGGKEYPPPEMVGNPIQIPGEAAPPGSKFLLAIRNNGEVPVYPIAVLICEVLR